MWSNWANSDDLIRDLNTMIIVWYYWCHIILNCRLITSALGRSFGRWQLNRFWISFLNTVGLSLDVTIKVSLLDHKNEKFKFSKTLFKNTFLVIQRFKLFTMLLSLNSTLEAVLSGPPQNMYRSSINTVIKKPRLSKTKLKVFSAVIPASLNLVYRKLWQNVEFLRFSWVWFTWVYLMSSYECINSLGG